jgi:hypothetical protein
VDRRRVLYVGEFQAEARTMNIKVEHIIVEAIEPEHGGYEQACAMLRGYEAQGFKLCAASVVVVRGQPYNRYFFRRSLVTA